MRNLFLCLFLAIPFFIKAQNYCDVSYLVNLVHISKIDFGSSSDVNAWSQPFRFMYENAYKNYVPNKSLHCFVKPSTSIPVRVRTGLNDVPVQVTIYIDWNGDKLFDYSLDLGFKTGINSTYSGNIDVPANAVLGETIMRVVAEISNGVASTITPCNSTAAASGEALDFKLIVKDNNTMVFKGIETKSNDNYIYLNSFTKEMLLGINIKTEGGGENLSLKNIKVDFANSTNLPGDISSGQVKYTKGHGIAHAIQQATSNSISINTNTTFTNNLNNHLLPGDNWFWIYVTPKQTASVGDIVSASISSISIDDNGQTTTIPVTNATATREINGLSYCLSDPNDNGTRGSFHMDSVQIANFNFDEFEPNSSVGNWHTLYASHIPAIQLCYNTSFKLRVKHALGPQVPHGAKISAFFDWNQDGDFNDSDEHYFVSVTPASVIEGPEVWVEATITPPSTAKPGKSLLRLGANSSNTSDPCNVFYRDLLDFAFYLNTPGELSVTNQPTFIGDKQKLELNAVNITPNFSYQYSTDLSNWNTYNQSNNQASFETHLIDTTTYFRLIDTTAQCYNQEYITSGIAAIPYVGINHISPTNPAICEGDSILLTASYEYEKTYFRNVGAGAQASDMFVSELELEVENINEQHINLVSIDSVCIKVLESSSNQLSLYLVAPNTNKEVNILLAENIQLSDLPNSELNRYCFSPSGTYPNASTGLQPGNYGSKDSFDRLFGINPNGTWTIMGYTDVSMATDPFFDFEMFFGINKGVTWDPNEPVVDEEGKQIRVSPNSTSTYKSGVTNKYGAYTDSAVVVVDQPKSFIASIYDIYPNPACLNDSIFFSASLNENTDEDQLKWSVNDVFSGTSGNKFNADNLINGDEISVTIEIENACGIYGAMDAKKVEIMDLPDTYFTYTSVEKTFTPIPNQSYVSYSWDFGDGNFSTEKNPNHTYENDGTYDVCLTIATEDGCTQTSCESVLIKTIHITNYSLNNSYGLYPNPAQNKLHITGTEGTYTYKIFNAVGKEVMYKTNSNNSSIDIDQLLHGNYIISISDENQIIHLSFLKM